MKKTNLQILIGVLSEHGINESDKDDAILEYFFDQESVEYNVGIETYHLFDEYDVRDMLRSEIEKDLEEFKQVINKKFQEYDKFISYEDIISDKLDAVEDEFGVELPGFTHIDTIDGCYIYKEDND